MISRKKGFRIVFYALFLIVSCLFITPTIQVVESEFHSLQLQKVITQNENTKRIDYIDSNGKLTVAGNLGYATCIITRTENRELEQYYDENGQPINRDNRYYAILREYDDKGNNIRIIYQDIHGNPVMLAGGYAIEKREYNEKGQIITARYYDKEEKPILTPSYGYGKKNEYDENGQISRITYIDNSGDPMMTGMGYASVLRKNYTTEGPENGKAEYEFYFDDAGNPICLSLGQYGVHKEYDEYGRESVLTYLDANGQPIITNRGYTTIARTYHVNGTIATELYYDLEGNPYALSEGQYGVKKEKNQTIYLNQSGEETFNLKNLLYNHSWIIIFIAIIMIIVSGMVEKKLNIFFLVMYICTIGYLTLMFRENTIIRGPGFFLSYGSVLSDGKARADILKNIWLFIPLGAFLYRVYPKKIVLLVPVILSIMIEGIQYFSRLGFCELDDVISNGLGGWIGFFMEKLTINLKKRIIK